MSVSIVIAKDRTPIFSLNISNIFVKIILIAISIPIIAIWIVFSCLTLKDLSVIVKEIFKTKILDSYLDHNNNNNNNST